LVPLDVIQKFFLRSLFTIKEVKVKVVADVYERGIQTVVERCFTNQVAQAVSR